jgi:RecJ-like exonuclease
MILFGKPMRLIALAGLYILASPVYAALGVRKLVKLFQTRQTLASGEVSCPHCGERNVLDILATCGQCKVTEYGNRLRCNACGEISKGFECDACGVTIRVL